MLRRIFLPTFFTVLGYGVGVIPLFEETAAEVENLESLAASLNTLEKRQHQLEAQLKNGTGGKEKRLRSKLKVIKAQHKKGVACCETPRKKSRDRSCEFSAFFR